MNTPKGFDLKRLKIYQKSNFQVRNSGGRLITFTTATIHDHPDLARKKFAVITAWNPMTVVLSKRVNQARNQKLDRELKKAHYFYYPSKGWFGDHSEDSFTVENILVREAKALGASFQQYAIFYHDFRGARFLRCYPSDIADGERLKFRLKC